MACCSDLDGQGRKVCAIDKTANRMSCFRETFANVAKFLVVFCTAFRAMFRKLTNVSEGEHQGLGTVWCETREARCGFQCCYRYKIGEHG